MPEGYKTSKTKYVIVFGTVMSGLGKGIFSSSLASVLKDGGFSISPVKLEGYLNKDSGTLNPYRHGEVFVLDDGMECDMDLGTYERMLDINLTRKNFITSGQIFASVLEKERKGEYLGRDVQIIPHVTGEVKLRLRQLAVDTKADIIFVEVGGTVGDLENTYIIEAIREMSYEEGNNNFCFVALTHILEPKILGEQKSKPAQLSLKLLNAAGIQPHIIGCRASSPVTKQIREKISLFTNVPINRIFSMHDSASIYNVPDMLENSGIVEEVLDILGYKDSGDFGKSENGFWVSYLDKMKKCRSISTQDLPIKIGIIGKYTSVRDSYASIIQALEHCGVELGVYIEIQYFFSDVISKDEIFYIFDGIDGVIVPGGFGSRGADGKVECIQYFRENKIPFLGICYGMQLAAIEFAKNVAGLIDANTTEIESDCLQPVVDLLPSQDGLCDTGGTMRLGGELVNIIDDLDSIAGQAFNKLPTKMRFRHRYEINPEYVPILERYGMIFSGWNAEDGVKQILELPIEVHPFFLGTQSHPEFLSRPGKPEPLFLSFVRSVVTNQGSKFV
jgi:CTP synthase